MSIIKPLTYTILRPRPTRALFDPKVLNFKNPETAGGNLPNLVSGFNQRKAVIPKDPTLEGNKKKIGFFQPNILDTAVDNPWVNQRPDFFTRYVRIFLGDVECSHKVPVLPKGYSWIVQFERQGIYKNQNMGWTYINDTQSKRPVKFKTLEDCLEYCRKLGLGYEISYPHFRYHTRKNYGDNFKWLGQPKAEDQDW